MKMAIAFIILVLSIVAAIYVGGYLMFYSGLTFLIGLFIEGSAALSAAAITLAIIKVFFAALVGWFIVFLGMGLAAVINEL
jgi:hypothetical protein